MALKEYRDIMREDVPCWYEISFEWASQDQVLFPDIFRVPFLVIRISQDVIGVAELIKQDAWYVTELSQKFEFVEFSGSLDNQYFGFERSFRITGQNKGFREFKAEIPQIKQKTEESCEQCDGSGWDEELERECLMCRGSGVKYTYHWQAAYALSATLSLLFLLLDSSPEKETHSLLPQLMTVRTITDKDMHGGSIDGVLSVAFCKYLISQNPERCRFRKAEQVMKAVHQYMLGESHFDESHIRAELFNGRLSLECPGDRTGIYPSTMGFPKQGEGYAFSCHNVDSPAQQITLLIGLAVLHRIARGIA